MSADEILAANLWPWPDPLLKRDSNGQVLFVNAAFLQLYGGRIEDWRGNIVSGWPAPSPQGAQRFETRAGEPPHQTVYDWVEMAMADGNAMAIARNITALIPAPTPPANVFVPPPVETAPPIQADAPAAPPFQAATPPVPVHQPVAAPVETAPPPAPIQVPGQAPAPVFEAHPESVVAHTPEPVVAATEGAPDLSEELEDTLNRSADDYLNQPESELDADITQLTSRPAAEGTPTQEQPQESRMIERRALPIEDSTAVLGSNWRDQVIAKAVGAEVPQDRDEEASDDVPDLTTESDEGIGAPLGSDGAAGLHILLAEDNAINALLTRTLLEAEGAMVDTVEDGALALEAVQKTKYDLIFMDMRMPNMDGLESTRKIRALGGAHKEIPIVALTANAFDDDRNACFDSGMNDFMTKPVSAEELQEMVLNWTKERQKMAS